MTTFRTKLQQPQKKKLPGISDDETAEHSADPGAGPGDAHCGSACSDKLSSSVNVPAHCAGLEATERHLLLGGQERGSLGNATNPGQNEDRTTMALADTLAIEHVHVRVLINKSRF